MIVSAFMTNINSNRTNDKYIEYGKFLIQFQGHKIIFIERYIYELYNLRRYENETTIFIFFEKHEIYFYKIYGTDFSKTQSSDLFENFYQIKHDNQEKNTLDYMFVQCHKTEWLRMAIELTEKTENLKVQNFNQFVWIDFGIYHMIEETERKNWNLFLSSIINPLKKYNNIRIASGWNLETELITEHPDDIYKRIVWYFLGSVVGGDKYAIIAFSYIMKSITMKICNQKKLLMWEINIWWIIYKMYPELFDCYLCNHNSTILKLY